MTANPDNILRIEGVSQQFGRNNVLHNVNLTVRRGEFVALVGPSGCGKTTLLNCIVGSLQPTSGRVLISDGGDLRPVDGPGRDRGIVYQQYALFPHLTAQENVALGLKLDQTNISFRLFKPATWRRLKKRHLAEAVRMLEQMKLGSALAKYPGQMSGGMCQRVAIAQALVMKPAILLLDEPFGALDEATREEMQRILLTLYSQNLAAVRAGQPAPFTVLIVTHEINEAIFVSNRVIGLSQYWAWEHDGFDACPGATIVYDKPAPVFSPQDERDFVRFRMQKDEVLHVVCDPAYRQDRRDYIQLAEATQQAENHGVNHA